VCDDIGSGHQERGSESVGLVLVASTRWSVSMQDEMGEFVYSIESASLT
jgi:hypothetical protein